MYSKFLFIAIFDVNLIKILKFWSKTGVLGTRKVQHVKILKIFKKLGQSNSQEFPTHLELNIALNIQRTGT